MKSLLDNYRDLEPKIFYGYLIRELKSSLQNLETLSDSEKRLPKKIKFRRIKKNILRLLRPHTAIQTAFNRLTVDLFKKMLKKISLDVTRLSREMISLRNMNISRKKDVSNVGYRSQFFPAHEENFYAYQQDRFRGSFDLIKNRQKQYIPYLKTIKNLSKLYPFLEVGFGRGEFLEILKETGIQKILGVEVNKMRVSQARTKGFEAKQADAIDFLLRYDGKLSGISAFHLVEHISFEQIFDLLYAAYQKLEEGGLVIVETPNPENLQVGSWSFYIDHTHITKLPSGFLQSIFDYIGYSHIQIIYSSPLKINLKSEIQKMIYGPMDYAVVAYK